VKARARFVASPTCTVDPGSFRDRQGRVYHAADRVLRGLSAPGLESWNALERSNLFRRFTDAGKLVRTRQLESTAVPAALAADGWAAVLEHQKIPFVSYPSEWCFGMLRDAALLHLELLDAALDEGLILQDATPFNVQWRGVQPVFIDIPSFVPLAPGQPWVAYRQFCEQFLYPLMLQAYRGVSFQPWLRGGLEGISAADMRGLMSWRDVLRPGVLLHVCIQARLQARFRTTRRDVRGELRDAGFSKELVRANVRRLTRLVRQLTPRFTTSAWSEYERKATYASADRERKEAFVRRVAESREWGLVWDLGCNAGRFARIAARHARCVVALDADAETIETLYRQLQAEGCDRILPLVVDVADPSPNRGWRGRERKALTERGKPDLVLCLALLHHLVLGAGFPLREAVDWLAESCQHLVVEFVTRDDPMAQTLLRHKTEQYADYSLPFFEQCFRERFELLRRETLGSGTRILYHGRARG
jgi:SAM-dependent methyltransferase